MRPSPSWARITRRSSRGHGRAFSSDYVRSGRDAHGSPPPAKRP